MLFTGMSEYYQDVGGFQPGIPEPQDSVQIGNFEKAMLFTGMNEYYQDGGLQPVYLTPGFCVVRELQESDAFYRNE